jgi:hypothetical protein
VDVRGAGAWARVAAPAPGWASENRELLVSAALSLTDGEGAIQRRAGPLPLELSRADLPRLFGYWLRSNGDLRIRSYILRHGRRPKRWYVEKVG